MRNLGEIFAIFGVKLCKKAPKSDIIVFVVTFALTVFFDLVVAIEIGLIVAAALFLKRMSDTASIRGWKYSEDEENELNSLSLEEHYKFYENQGLDKKEIIKKIAKDRNVSKNEIYMKFI